MLTPNQVLFIFILHNALQQSNKSFYIPLTGSSKIVICIQDEGEGAKGRHVGANELEYTRQSGCFQTAITVGFPDFNYRILPFVICMCEYISLRLIK